MTSINGLGTPGVSGPNQAASAGTAAAAVSAGSASGSAAYLAALLGAGSPGESEGGSSGLRSPVNPENSEALLLLVESQLDQASSAARGAALAGRYGAAQNTISNSSAALRAASDAVSSAAGNLGTAQAKLDADTSAKADQSVIDSDKTAVSNAQARLQQAQTALASLGPSSVRTAIDLIAAGLRADTAQDGSHAAIGSAHRDIAYQDVADAGKAFRDREVDGAHREGAERARRGAARGEDRGEAMAAALAAGAADAIATIQALRATLPPAVAPTAAVESGGRVRLSL